MEAREVMVTIIPLVILTAMWAGWLRQGPREVVIAIRYGIVKSREGEFHWRSHPFRYAAGMFSHLIMSLIPPLGIFAVIFSTLKG